MALAGLRPNDKGGRAKASHGEVKIRLPIARLGKEAWLLFYCAMGFLTVAVIAGLLGFGTIAAVGIARMLFFVFLALSVGSLVSHLNRGQSI